MPSVVHEGVDLLRLGGRYCLVGNIVAGASVPFVPHDMVRTSNELIGLVTYDAGSSPAPWTSWPSDPTVPFPPPGLRPFPLDDITRAFEDADWAAAQGHVGRSVVRL